MNTPTPRTDAQEQYASLFQRMVHSSFARTLERELVTLREELFTSQEQALKEQIAFGAEICKRMELEEQLAAVSKDAERYRWLRVQLGVHPDKYHRIWLPMGNTKVTHADCLITDVAIDAAIAATKEQVK